MPLSAADIQLSNHWLTDVIEINRRVKVTLEGVAGLTVTQFRAMLELRVNGDHLACGTLSTLLFVSPSAVTHALDDLVERGYIVRKPLESNRRVVLADLTSKGHEAFSRANNILVEMLRREAWSNLSDCELARLVYATALSTGPFAGHTLIHPDVPVEPCYITCAIIQQASYEKVLKPYRMSIPELRACVFALGATGGFAQSEVCEELLMDRRALSRAVLALKRRGVLRDLAGSERAGLLELTEDGRALAAELFKKIEQTDTDICVGPQSPSVEELNYLGELVYQALRASYGS